MTALAATDPQLTGLTGFFADFIDTVGEVGVGVLTLLETLVPPVPSEVVLPLAGFLAHQGRLSLLWVVVLATAGSLIGAWVFYALGARLGLERALTLVSKVPLVDRADLDKASDWFHRHGRSSVFFGRFVPGVRSLISLPAGAQRMPLLPFSLATAAGSAIWNAALVGAGYALGTQWEKVGSYVGTASNILLAGLGVLLIAVVVRRAVQRARRPVDEVEHSRDEVTSAR
ncbi:DedA family protein [Knoellia koreensis]|uniref:DedA family protein n=1 Tax=Knoellia koreensis TaxID=2730921 RepID=A0A849HBI3_9MICO|nr:DedA family protein [Knoellia sp. DB2414S]NNM45295.1 DedA family protein [Knoellia sp. DB2414S]